MPKKRLLTPTNSVSESTTRSENDPEFLRLNHLISPRAEGGAGSFLVPHGFTGKGISRRFVPTELTAYQGRSLSSVATGYVASWRSLPSALSLSGITAQDKDGAIILK